MGNKKLKVSICGAGVGGLSFAVAISKYPDIDVEVYEAISQFSVTGAGIGIWPRAWEALKSIGLEVLASKAACQPVNDAVRTFAFRISDQPDGCHFYDLITQGSLMTFHRADFQGLLIQHLPQSLRIQYSKRLQSYDRLPSGQLELHFQDGSQTTCDVLVGADGIKSAVRSLLLHEQAEVAVAGGHQEEANVLLDSIAPTWTGTVAYRFLVPPEKLKEISTVEVPNCATHYLGKNRHMIAYPISNGKLFNVTIFVTDYKLANTSYNDPWVAEVKKDELLTLFSDWEPEAQAWLRCVERTTKWAIHTIKPLPFFASDGIVLLGDAAHAMAPHHGSGAGQAIEDGCFLAKLLGHHLTTAKTLTQVFDLYNTLRRPFAMDIAERSFQTGRLLSFNHPDFCIDACTADERNKKLKELGDAILEVWTWAWSTSLDDMIQEGIQTLESGAGSREP